MLSQNPCSDFKELEEIHLVSYIKALKPLLCLQELTGQGCGYLHNQVNSFWLTVVSCILKKYTLCLHHLEYTAFSLLALNMIFVKDIMSLKGIYVKYLNSY